MQEIYDDLPDRASCQSELKHEGRIGITKVAKLFNFRSRLYWFIYLSLLLVILLSVSACYVVSELTHPGEQTAMVMLADTDGYLTINLRPGIGQSLEFKRFLDSFLTDPTVDNQMQDLASQFEDEWGIDFEQEVLPWLGPEVALGLKIWSPLDQGVMSTLIIGTTDEAATQQVLDKWLLPGEGRTISTEDYRGITITTVVRWETETEYYALTSGYVLMASSEVDLDRFKANIDLILDGGTSLWDDADFQDVRANLPEHMGMGYGDVAQFLDILEVTIENPADLDVFNALTPYAPSFTGLSFSCVDKGIKFHLYSPTTAAWDFIADQPNPLSVLNLIPGDILGFYADHNIQAWWDESCEVISAIPEMAAAFGEGIYTVEGAGMEPGFHHGDGVLVKAPIGEVIGRGDVVIFTHPADPNVLLMKRVIGLPGETVEITGGIVYINGEALDEPYIAEPPIYAFAPEVVPAGEYFLLGDNRNQSQDSHDFGFVPLANLQSKVVLNIDADIMSWMTGEFAFAGLPSWAENIGGGPDWLGLFQVTDQAFVQTKIDKIVAACQDSGEPIETYPATIEGVDATLVHVDGTEVGGYLFLDDFLVAGTSQDALTAVVLSYEQPELSVTQSAKFQKMSSFLPASKTGLVFADVPRIMNFILSIPDVTPQDRESYFQDVAPLIEPLQGLALSYFIGSQDSTMTMYVHVERVFTTHTPYPDPHYDEVVAVQAQILGGTGVQQAALVWSVDGAPQTELDMYDDSAHGDEAAGDGIYGVEVGPFATGTVVEYQVRVTDNDGDIILAPSYPRSFQSLGITWLVPLSASSLEGEGFQDPDNFAGVAPDAGEQYDYYDAFNPPTPPSPYLDLLFPHQDWDVNPGNYAQDIRPPADSIIWQFNVRNAGFDGDVTIDWDVSQVPGSYHSVLLEDLSSGAITDMRSVSNYTYNAFEGEIREFNFIVSEKFILRTTFSVGWNMFSLPLHPDPVDWDHQLGDDISPLHTYYYDPGINGYRMHPPTGIPATNGWGYWTVVYSETSVDVEGFLASDEPQAIRLLPGWNQIGQPFNYSVDWGDVSVYNTATEETVDILTAHENGWVLKYMYWYNPDVSGYTMETAPDGQLDVWKGYWVRALVECDLIIPNTPIT
ncbi:signal peptidase I [Chloroflexota bacterium]